MYGEIQELLFVVVAPGYLVTALVIIADEGIAAALDGDDDILECIL